MRIENAEAYKDILQTECSSELQREMKALADENGPYTTTLLVAIAVYLENIGDEDGAAMLLDFARNRFAVHEANTV